jgi:hypothetical protein
MMNWDSRHIPRNLGIIGVVLAAGAGVLVCYSHLSAFRPAIRSWHMTNETLVIRVSVSNRSSRALCYCHHPFPVRFLTDRGWTDAEIVNGFRCTTLAPKAELVAEVIVTQPKQRPIGFEVGSDFETQRSLPSWLVRLEASSLSRLFRPVLRPLLGWLEEPRPVPCLWSKEMPIANEDWPTTR